MVSVSCLEVVFCESDVHFGSVIVLVFDDLLVNN